MIKPHGKRLLIEVRIDKLESSSGIIIPDEVKDKASSEGTVLSTGSECTIKKGEYVLFNDFTGKAVEWEEKQLLIIDEDEVLATIEDE
tara:strand:- start:16412 stop:16675 length:264 start_codon:yes stop_codon:yes gene_type:complete